MTDAALVMTREQRIFSVQDQRSDQVLNIVGVHFDAAVFKENLQAVEMAGDIAKLFAEARFCRDALALLGQPATEFRHQWCTARLTHGQALLCGPAPDLVLEGIEFGNTAQAFRCDRRAVAFVDVVEFPATMRPTE